MYRSLITAGKIHRYEINVVEIAIVKHHHELRVAPAVEGRTATTMKTVAKIPDSTFTRTGVPSLRLKTPK